MDKALKRRNAAEGIHGDRRKASCDRGRRAEGIPLNPKDKFNEAV